MDRITSRRVVALSFAVASVAALSGSLRAAGADVVTTKDGLVLEGGVTKAADGSVVVSTDAGDVKLAPGTVASIVAGEGPRAAARKASAALGASDVDGHFRLALALESKGQLDLAREEYRAIVAIDPQHAAARRALGYEKVDGQWLAADDAKRRRGLVQYGGRWMLPQEVDLAAKPRRRASPKDATTAVAMRTAAKGERALALAAAERLELVPIGERVETAIALLLDGDAKVRRYACSALAAAGDEAALRPLLASAVRDRDESVRKSAVEAAATFGHDDAAIPLVTAMWSEHPGIVANAAKSLAMLGDTRAIRWIVKRIESHGGVSPRGYFSQIDQTSYIRDFDVEVAQTSSIADPQIGVIQEGVVQDAHVLDVSIEQTIIEQVLVDSFNSLARAQAKSPAQVSAWWKEHGAEVAQFPKQPAPRKPRATK